MKTLLASFCFAALASSAFAARVVVDDWSTLSVEGIFADAKDAAKAATCPAASPKRITAARSKKIVAQLISPPEYVECCIDLNTACHGWNGWSCDRPYTEYFTCGDDWKQHQCPASE